MIYTKEKHTRMLISLLKENGIHRIIVSPGATNVTFVISVQNDPFFKLYSCVDERSAAYIACGLAESTGEPVVLSCTGATASRNYYPALTEAYYKKLPILVVSSSQFSGNIDNNIPQVTHRDQYPKDSFSFGVTISEYSNEEKKWECNLNINKAINVLKDNRKGPVHINLETNYSQEYSAAPLEMQRKIEVVRNLTNMPSMSFERIAIYASNKIQWTNKLTSLVDKFCEKYNAFVICDHTSNYKGKYGIMYSLIVSQQGCERKYKNFDLIIDLGEISGAYMKLCPVNVWRVNQDGKIKDSWHNLKYVFEMGEETFFSYYNDLLRNDICIDFYTETKEKYLSIHNQIKDLPFSNIWIASRLSKKLPFNSNLHFGILNSLRSWNFFEVNKNIKRFCNTGGFGIDGIVSTFVGVALSDLKKTNYLICGDLAFFYDINVLGNKHFPKNVVIVLINNGGAAEFKNYNHNASFLGSQLDNYVCAKGHFNHISKFVVKDIAKNFGFDYLSCDSKDTFIKNCESNICNRNNSEKPLIVEAFVDQNDDSLALEKVCSAISSNSRNFEKAIKGILGKKTSSNLKKFINSIRR